MSFVFLWLVFVISSVQAAGEGVCPVLQENDSPDILAFKGLQLFVDLNDNKLRDAPESLFQFSDNGTIYIVNDAIINDYFAVRAIALYIPAISSSLVTTIPFHIRLTNSSKEVFYSLSIISTNPNILGPFNEVSPNGIAITPGVVTDLGVSFCCKDVGTVLLEGCLTIAKEPFDNVTAGPYTTIGPFYANYDCKEESIMSCPSSMDIKKAKVQLCFTGLQAQALVTQPAWQLLIGGADSFCALTTTTLEVRTFLQSKETSKDVPLPADFPSLDFYFNRAIIEPLIWTSPTYYFLTVDSDNTTVIENVNVSIPLQGSFDTDTLYFSMYFPCLTNGGTILAFTMNTSGLVETYVVNNTFTFYLYKVCMPFNETNDIIPINTDGRLSVILPTSIPAAVVFIILVASLTGIIVGVYSKMKKRQLVNLEELALSTSNTLYNAYTITSGFSPFDFLEEVDDLEYNYAALELEDKLGEGFFGNVYKAKAPGIARQGHEASEFVAVKTLKNGSNIDTLNEFAKELKLCLQFNHPHVIKLVGACTESIEKCMIFEYMDVGSLDHCLRWSNPSDPLYNPTNFIVSKKDFLPIVIQLAKGVQYLTGLNITHRDLAARNCLINSKLTAKIADFGLSRNLDAQNYYKVGGTGGSLPIRWMPPEAILYRKFTSKSDVWSFGVLMWEVYTFGKIPYTGLSNHEVIDAIRDHKVPDQPGGCPIGVYDIMNNCWIKIPAHRPEITQIICQLEGCK